MVLSSLQLIQREIQQKTTAHRDGPDPFWHRLTHTPADDPVLLTTTPLSLTVSCPLVFKWPIECTVLAVALAFGRFDLFLKWFDRCSEHERRHWHGSFFWPVVLRSPQIWNASSSLPDPPRQVIRVLALLHLLVDGRSSLAGSPLQSAMTSFSFRYAPDRPARAYIDCIQELTILTPRRCQAERRHDSSSPLVPGNALRGKRRSESESGGGGGGPFKRVKPSVLPSRLPALPALILLEIASGNANLDDWFPSREVRGMVMTQVWETLFCCRGEESRVTDAVDEILVLHLEEAREALERLLGGYAAPPPAFVTPVIGRPTETRGYAWEVFSGACSTREVELDRRKLSRVQVTIPGGPYQVVLNRRDRKRFTKENRAYIFVRHGVRSTHPRLVSRLKRWGGRVPRLRFGHVRSDGILIPRECVFDRDEEEEDEKDTEEILHGRDITDRLDLFRVRKPRRAGRKCRPPKGLRTRCLIEPRLWRMIQPPAPHELFLWRLLAFNLAGPRVLCALWTPAASEMVNQLVRCHLQPQLNLSRAPPPAKVATIWRRLHAVIKEHPSSAVFFQPVTRAVVWLAQRHQESPFLALADAFAHPSVDDLVLEEMLKVIHEARLTLTVLLREHQLASPHLLCVLYHPRSPPNLKRLAWQTLSQEDLDEEDEEVLAMAISRFPVLSTPSSPPVFPSPRCELPVGFGVEHAFPLMFDRGSGEIINIRELPSQDPALYDVMVIGETEAVGLSTFSESLRGMWTHLLQRHLVAVEETDGGLCVAPPHVLRAHNPVETVRRFMGLGVLSALCVRRGLHLPFPLHRGWWRFLDRRVLPSDQTPSLESLFPERRQTGERTWAGLSVPEIMLQLGMDVIDLTAADQPGARERLIRDSFLPDPAALTAFAAGWNYFIHPLPLWPLLDSLNSIFTDGYGVRIDHTAFRRCFLSRDPLDEVFLKYVDTLDPPALAQLVEFISGKKRLPYHHELGEDLLSVVFVGRKDLMPRAQNCTSTLLLPAVTFEDHTESELIGLITAWMRPVFEFATVFGFE